MLRPLAFKLTDQATPDVHRICLEAGVAPVVQASGKQMPAILVVGEATMLPSGTVGVLDASDVIASTDGDWSTTILIVLGDESSKPALNGHSNQGDDRFLNHVKDRAPDLHDLASQTIEAIRQAGVEGELAEAGGGRWVNRPINTFTLKVQPRAGNLHFTLYGNPNSYQAEGFLLSDQNSYSRGWVKDLRDASRLAALAKQSHGRRADR